MEGGAVEGCVSRRLPSVQTTAVQLLARDESMPASEAPHAGPQPLSKKGKKKRVEKIEVGREVAITVLWNLRMLKLS